MPSPYFLAQQSLRQQPRFWLVTGGAGFIGSHVVEKLLSLGQRVRVLDNHFSSTPANLQTVRGNVGPEAAARLDFVAGDIRHAETCAAAVTGVDQVIHLAALGSVPLSLEKPALCHDINATGTLNLMLAARAAGLRRFAYASSSAVYGDDPLPAKREDSLGRLLSPYAASKFVNEVYAATCQAAYGLETVGLRFFNVFGPRQDPKGAYAAVIPCWIDAMARGDTVFINGDGENTRDFCFVSEVVQALLLASLTENGDAFGRAFNVGLGAATTLNELCHTLRALVAAQTGRAVEEPVYRDFRPGDIRHSRADTSLVAKTLGFQPEFSVESGLRETVVAVLKQSRTLL